MPLALLLALKSYKEIKIRIFQRELKGK